MLGLHTASKSPYNNLRWEWFDRPLFNGNSEVKRLLFRIMYSGIGIVGKGTVYPTSYLIITSYTNRLSALAVCWAGL